MAGRDVYLNILLPKRREHPGWIRIEIDGTPKGEFRVLGRGSTTDGGKPTGNPTLNPFVNAGNTPVGDYVSPGFREHKGKAQRSYGPNPAIRLRAVAGDALIAQDIFGRNNLLIHGGPPGRFDGLSSTLGCLRLKDDDMSELIRLISNAGENAQAARCEGVSVRVAVRE